MFEGTGWRLIGGGMPGFLGFCTGRPVASFEPHGWVRLAGRFMLTTLAAVALAAEPKPVVIPVERPAAGGILEFYRDVLPLLRPNCLPCHNKTSSKADLLLESPADMVKGGESGTALIPGKPAQSLVLQVATHEVKPRMPPKENKAGARDLTPRELGVLSAWIEQGAKSTAPVADAIAWQSLAPEVRNIAAVAVTADGRLAACGRGNHLAIYDLDRGGPVANLLDPAVDAAHRDTVNAVALSPDGEWLASGGFREVKLWRRLPPTAGPAREWPTNPSLTILTNVAEQRLVVWGGPEPARLTDLTGTNVLARLETDRVQEFALAEARRQTNLVAGRLSALGTALESVRKELPVAVERRQKAIIAWEGARTNLAAKQLVRSGVLVNRDLAEYDVLRAERTGDTNRVKAATDKREAAAKALEAPEREWKQAQDKQGAAEEELRLAHLGLTRATMAVSSAERNRAEAEAELGRAKAQLEATELAAKKGAAHQRVLGAWLAEGQLVTAHQDGSRRTWNRQTGAALDVFRDLAPGDEAPFIRPAWRLVRTMGSDTNSPFADRINALAFRPDGSRLAIGSGDPSRGGDVHVLEPITGQFRYVLTNLHSDSVLALAWSPDGRWLATGGADRLARLVDTASTLVERVFEGHTAHVMAVGWSPDGRLLATGGAEGAVKIWEPFTGEKRKGATGAGKEITGVAFVNAEQVVTSTGDPSITVWKVGGDKVRDYEKPPDYQQALAVTPDGQVIVAGGMDGVLRVWRGAEAKPVWTFAPPTGPLGWN